MAMSVQAPARSLNVLLADYWEEHLRNAPEEATALGDKRYNDRWSDLSIVETERPLRRNQEYVRRLRAIDTTGLSAQDKLSVDLLLRDLLEDQESARFKEWEMPLNQIHGIHFEIPQLVSVTAFDSVNDYDNYIARLRKVPRLFSQLTENMKRGIIDGRVQPKIVSEKVLEQVNSILAIPPEDSPFFAPTKRFPESISAVEQRRISREIDRAITRDVVPAYRKLAIFLQTKYIPNGRSEPGIWSIPNGDAYYAFCIRRNTTLAMTADQIHQIGLEEVQRDEAAMLAIAQKLGYSDLKSFNAATSANPGLHPASRRQLLDVYRIDLNQMKVKLPELFGKLPKADLIEQALFLWKDSNAQFADCLIGAPNTALLYRGT